MPIDPAQLLPFLTLGVLGAGHCAGMCGGFAIAVRAASGRGRWTALRRQLLYVLGKSMTYAAIGLFVARVGEVLVHGGTATLGGDDDTLAGIQRAMSWLAGGTMVTFGTLVVLGRGAPAPDQSGRLWKALRGAMQRARRVFDGALQLGGESGAFATGMITGHLPCGWSWGALALCVAQPPLVALLGMFVFGLATGPVLVFLGLGWGSFSARFTGLAARAAGPLLIAFGLFTLLRGAPPGASDSLAAEVLPECCVEQSTTHEHPAR